MRRGECAADYYDRLVLGDREFERRRDAVEADVLRQRQADRKAALECERLGNTGYDIDWYAR